MKALEEDEDSIEVLRLDANAVVSHRKCPACITPSDRDGHHWRNACSDKLDAIRDEVLKKLVQLSGVAQHSGQLFVLDRRTHVFDRPAKIADHPIGEASGVHRLDLERPRTNSRIREQVVDKLLHPARAVNRKANELIRVLVQLALVTPRE